MKKLLATSMLLALTSCAQDNEGGSEPSRLAQIMIKTIGMEYSRVELSVKAPTNDSEAIIFSGEELVEARLESGIYNLELSYFDTNNAVILSSLFCVEPLRLNGNVFQLVPGTNELDINVCTADGENLADLVITPLVHDGHDHEGDHEHEDGHDHENEDGHEHEDGHDHDHGDDSNEEVVLPKEVTSIDQINAIDAATYNLGSFVGYDPVKRAFGEEDSCFVFVVAKVIKGETTTYYLRSSFRHGGASHEAFGFTWTAEEDLPGTIQVNAEGSEGFARLKYQSADFDSITEFTTKWLHADHYHTDQCRDLTNR